MHHILARISVKPEAADRMRGILGELMAASLRDAGCAGYEVYQQVDAPHVFQTVEAWNSAADADAHMKTPHVGAAIAAATPLFTAPPEIVAWTKLS